MAKKQQREEDILERLERENRELKLTNRALIKRLKKIDRDFKAEVEEVNREAHLKEDQRFNPLLPKVKGPTCPTCEAGEVYKGKIVGYDYDLCTRCNYKKRTK